MSWFSPFKNVGGGDAADAAPVATPPSGGAPAGTTAFGAPAAGTTAFGAPPSGSTAFGTLPSSAPALGATTAFGVRSAATMGFGAALGSAAPAVGTVEPMFSFETPATSAPTPHFVGLGGIDVSATLPNLGDNTQDGINILETQVPDEILNTLDSLRAHVNQQKIISSSISMTSTSWNSNIRQGINNLMGQVQIMTDSVESYHQQIQLMRQETASAIQVTQSTQDTPADLQSVHNASFQYLQCLVAKYEEDMIAFRRDVDLTKEFIDELSHPADTSPENIIRCCRQLYEVIVLLAGSFDEVHQRVEELKERYLELRRDILQDGTNVFEQIDNPPPEEISSGPSPFSNIWNTSEAANPEAHQ